MDFDTMQKKLIGLGFSLNLKAEIEKEIRLYKNDCQNLREPKAIVLDGLPHSKAFKDSIGDKVAKIIDIYEKRIQDLVDTLEKDLKEREDLLSLISCLSIDEQNIIKEKYIEKRGWDFIPHRVNLSRAQCFRIHKKAINNLVLLWIDKHETT